MSKESFKVKVGLAEMLKGGVIMDVTNLEQAKIAEDASSAILACSKLVTSIITPPFSISAKPTLTLKDSLLMNYFLFYCICYFFDFFNY